MLSGANAITYVIKCTMWAQTSLFRNMLLSCCLVFHGIMPCYHGKKMLSCVIIMSGVGMLCYHVLLSCHVIISCYKVVARVIIMSCYHVMLSYNVIMTCYPIVLSWHVIMRFYHVQFSYRAFIFYRHVLSWCHVNFIMPCYYAMLSCFYHAMLFMSCTVSLLLCETAGF